MFRLDGSEQAMPGSWKVKGPKGLIAVMFRGRHLGKKQETQWSGFSLGQLSFHLHPTLNAQSKPIFISDFTPSL